MIGFLLNKDLATIDSQVISAWSPGEIFKQWEMNATLIPAGVRWGGKIAWRAKRMSTWEANLNVAFH